MKGGGNLEGWLWIFVSCVQSVVIIILIAALTDHRRTDDCSCGVYCFLW